MHYADLLTACTPFGTLATGQGSLQAGILPGLTADSRAVVPGGLFAALPGHTVDGRDFIGAAIGAGAAVILAGEGTSLPTGSPDNVALIVHPNPRRALALLAASFYASQPEPLVAVTGTNGKTSTVTFARQIWTRLGFPKAVSLGTLGLQGDGFHKTGEMTTPDPVSLHRTFADIRDRGGYPVAIEASSHALDQFRLDGVRLCAAALTNITRDHLDYHGSMEAYRAAKMRLFDEILPKDGTIVVNADIPEADTVRSIAQKRHLTIWDYGHRGKDFQILDATPEADGQRLKVRALGYTATVYLPLAGDFQAMNALCALGLVLGSRQCLTDPGALVPKALAALETLDGVPGRLERVARAPNGAVVYVDYAHTPDALQTALNALRPHCSGRLLCVFGCGGDRDPGKRPLMGTIATDLADVVIVTDDNPRSEDPAVIRSAILKAAPGALQIGDRAEAIAAAVSLLKNGDLLLIAGKGHETTQTVGTRVYPFNDAEIARSCVRGLKQ